MLVAWPPRKTPSQTAGVPQGKVANLVSDLAAQASAASLVSGLATKQDTIVDGSLSQSKVEAAGGATVQNGLTVNRNCNVAGQLVVNGINVLDQLTNAAASTAAIS